MWHAVLLLVAVPSTVWTPGSNKIANHFEAGSLPGLLSSAKRSYALRTSAKKNQALMVILTRTGCAACQNLKQSVNRGTKLRERLAEGNIVVAHAEGAAAAEWRVGVAAEAGYDPAVFFYPPWRNKHGDAEPLPIHGGSENSPFFLHDEETLLWAVDIAIGAVRDGKRGADNPDSHEL